MEIQNDRPWTMLWIEQFKNDHEFIDVRFKYLESLQVKIDFDRELIEAVSMEDFIRIENKRIPLFIGSQFGLIPRMDTLTGFYNGSKFFGVLLKSMLSGHVAGLKVYKINKGETDCKEYRFFRND
jgi:hypothetical protein